MLAWLGEHLTPSQIVGFPALVDLVAQIQLLGRIDTRDDDTVYCESPTSAFLCVDPEAGLRAICRAYATLPLEGTELGDTLREIESKMACPLAVVLGKLCDDESDRDCREGAAAIVSDYYMDA